MNKALIKIPSSRAQLEFISQKNSRHAFQRVEVFKCRWSCRKL